MLLINCKVELKLRWIKHHVLAVAGVENDDTNSNNIIFTIKDKKIYVLAVTLSTHYQQKTIKNYQNFLAKDLKDQCIKVNIKQKVRIKI